MTSFWIAHEQAMRGKTTWIPFQDPSPDLGIEIEVTRSVIGRLPTFAKLGVPEIWCFNGEKLRVLRLREDQCYQESARCLALPDLPLDRLNPYLRQDTSEDILTFLTRFRALVRTLLPE